MWRFGSKSWLRHRVEDDWAAKFLPGSGANGKPFFFTTYGAHKVAMFWDDIRNWTPIVNFGPYCEKKQQKIIARSRISGVDDRGRRIR